LGVVQEANGKHKEALDYYKKSLKVKFGLYGDKNDEVLDLQYKIASVYLLLKQFKESEQVLVSLTDVISLEKLKSNLDSYYRYGCYFYTLGIAYMKNNKLNNAKLTFKKALRTWETILPSADPAIQSLNNLYQICEDKIKNNF
jgi:tetratricopeptide (TPR) repeat protein